MPTQDTLFTLQTEMSAVSNRIRAAIYYNSASEVFSLADEAADLLVRISGFLNKIEIAASDDCTCGINTILNGDSHG